MENCLPYFSNPNISKKCRSDKNQSVSKNNFSKSERERRSNKCSTLDPTDLNGLEITILVEIYVVRNMSPTFQAAATLNLLALQTFPGDFSFANNGAV